MPPRCVAIGCKENGTHRFPRDPALRAKWEKAVNREHFKSTVYSRLCSTHFISSDYITEGYYTGLPTARSTLKKTAVPSVFQLQQRNQEFKRNTKTTSVKKEQETERLKVKRKIAVQNKSKLQWRDCSSEPLFVTPQDVCQVQHFNDSSETDFDFIVNNESYMLVIVANDSESKNVSSKTSKRKRLHL